MSRNPKRQSETINQRNEPLNKSEKERHTWWRLRIGALTRIFGSRYGGRTLYQFSDDDAGREDLRILLDHYVYSNPLAVTRVIKTRAPWLADTECEDLIDRVARSPRYWTSEALAGALRLTEAERIKLGGVPTIGAIDVTRRQRNKLRKDKNRIRMANARRAVGAIPRAAYEANGASRTKPWENAGISRATYYRRLKERRVCAQ
jgi:hypothetical protein